MSGISSSHYDSYYGQRTRTQQFGEYDEILCNNTKMEKIPAILFNKFTKLTKLTASNVGIEEINRDDFRSAGLLRNLDLSNNKISKLENMIFIYLTALKIVNLSRNEINSIHDGAFEDISASLIDIDLSYNKIEKFNENNLILLGTSSDLTFNLNLENNEIAEIPQSNSSKSSKIKLLNLQNNKIKIFDSSKLEIADLIINNNQLEVLNVIGVETLQADNNKLKKLFINKTMREVSAMNNEIRELNCDKNLSVESLSLSGNEITREMFAKLKDADKLKVLDLSHTMLGVLTVDAFAEMTKLEELNLNNAKIARVFYGIFSHQTSLKVLNIANNNLGFIDYHMFSTLGSLTTWDVSGNNLTKLEDHETFKEIFPNLIKVGLENNSWNCEYLSKLRLSMEKQGIKIDDPKTPVKNDTSVKGIGCSTAANSRINQLSTDDDAKKILEKLNEVIAITNNLITHVNEMKSNESNFKESIFDLEQKVFTLKSENFKNQLSTVNATDINEVRNIVEQMNNMTLERQKLANDQLIHKINEQNLEIAKHKVVMEKFLMNVKVDDSKVQAQQVVQEKSSGPSTSEVMLIMICCTIFILLVVLGVNYFKNFVKSNILRMQSTPMRVSRRNSTNTITTLNDSTL